MSDRKPTLLLLVAPALTMVLGLFVYPLALSLVSAFTARNGRPGLDNLVKAFELYGADILFTLVIVSVSTVLIGVLASAIGGYLLLCTHPAAVAVLKALYRALHSVHCRGAMHAHVPRQEWHYEQHARHIGAGRCGQPVRAPRLARHYHYLCLEGDPVCGTPRLRRHGGARPRNDRSCRQSRRRRIAHPPRHRTATGRGSDAGWPGIGICDDALGLVGADYVERWFADNDHGRHGLPRQFLQ